MFHATRLHLYQRLGHDVNVTPAIARTMGSDVTARSVEGQVYTRLRPIGKLQLEALKSGADPKDVDLTVNAKGMKGQKTGVSFSSAPHIFPCSFPCTFITLAHY